MGEKIVTIDVDQREVGQRLLVVFVQRPSCPFDGLSGDGVEAIGGDYARDGEVVIAGEYKTRLFLKRVETGLRVRSVSNDVAETLELIRLQYSHEFHHRLQGFQVAVNVRYEDIAHGALRCCLPSYSWKTNSLPPIAMRSFSLRTRSLTGVPPTLTRRRPARWRIT